MVPPTSLRLRRAYAWPRACGYRARCRIDLSCSGVALLACDRFARRLPRRSPVDAFSAPEADLQDEPLRHLHNRPMKVPSRHLCPKRTAATGHVCFGPTSRPVVALVHVAPGRQAAASRLGKPRSRTLPVRSKPVAWNRRPTALAGLQEEEIRRGQDNDDDDAPSDHGACDLLRSRTSSRLSF